MGLGQAFGSYDDYYNGHQDVNAITYLTLANKLIHQINPSAITIAEEMSGMPGLAYRSRTGASVLITVWPWEYPTIGSRL